MIHAPQALFPPDASMSLPPGAPSRAVADLGEPDEMERLRRENSYLKLRCSHLEADVTDLTASVNRLREQLEHNAARRDAMRANPLSGGQ